MRKSIIMPVGTIVASVTSIVPVQIFCDDITAMFISGSYTVNLALSNNAVLATFVATDLPSAKRMINAINTAMNVTGGSAGNDFTVIENYNSALAFVSVTPNTVAVSAGGTFVIAGTGFQLVGIDRFKAEDAGNPVDNDVTQGFSIDSDVQITVIWPANSMANVTTYTIYYSKDLGVTWTTTGLTIAAS